MIKMIAHYSCIRFLALMIAVLLSGCSGLQTNSTLMDASGSGGLAMDIGESEDSTSEEAVASFEPDTLYDLLVAEIGGQRKRYDLALGNYLKQAHKTRDSGVAKRAYQIAVFIGARQAAQDAALLWSELEPGNVDALQAAALELIYTHEFDRALGKMRAVLALHGEAGFDYLASSAGELKSEERQNLLSVFEVIQKEYPDNIELALGRAVLLRQDDKNEQALAITRQLLKKDPDLVKAIIIQGRILNALERGDEAEQMLAEAVERHPERVRLRLLYARVLVHANKLTVAKSQFEKLLELSPNDREILLSLALITLENGMDAEAEKYFGKLLSIGQFQDKSNYYLGRLKERKGDFAAAKDHYLSVGPGKDFVASQVALSQMLVEQGEFAQAIEYIDKARKRNPAKAEPLYLLEGELLTKNNHLKKAMEAFNEGIALLPKSVNLLYSRAMLHERQGNMEGLEKDLSLIIEFQPDNAAALNALGYTLADRTDRFKEAEKLIRKAYELDKEDPAIMDSMGWVQYRLGNYADAEKYLRMAYEKYPDQEIAAHLGEVLWVMGRRDEASRVWEKALKESPESPILKETMERLRKQSEKPAKLEAVSQLP